MQEGGHRDGIDGESRDQNIQRAVLLVQWLQRSSHGTATHNLIHMGDSNQDQERPNTHGPIGLDGNPGRESIVVFGTTNTRLASVRAVRTASVLRD